MEGGIPSRRSLRSFPTQTILWFYGPKYIYGLQQALKRAAAITLHRDLAGTGNSTGSVVSCPCAFGTERKATRPGPLREQELNTTKHDFSAALTSLKPVPAVEVRLSLLMPCSHWSLLAQHQGTIPALLWLSLRHSGKPCLNWLTGEMTVIQLKTPPQT